MNILLVNPPYSRLKGAGQASYFPLGLGCLARAIPTELGQVNILNLEHPGPQDKPYPIDKETVYRFRSQSYELYQRSLADEDHPAWQDLKAALDKVKPDLVGVTVMTVDVGAAARITSLVKLWNNAVCVVWGGVHPTFEPDACLNENGVDFIISGEGEVAFRAFCEQRLQKKPDYSSVPGLSYLHDGGLVRNAPAPLITNLDEYFPPRRDCDLLPERYTPIAWGSIMASRGCPWQCTFCSSPVFWQRRLRYRDSGAVFNEIRDLVERGITRHFTFWDDSFTANAKKVQELCGLIIEQNLHITWKTATRIDLIDDELLELMRRAGCIQLQIGIETGSKRMATLLKKDVDPFKSIEVVKRIKSHGIGSGAFFMAGFHHETEADLEETFRLMKALETDEIVLNVFDPMPGSDCFNEMRRLGLIDDPIDWKDFPLWPDRHFARDIPQDRFERLLEQMSSWIFAANSKPARKWHKNKAELLFLLKYDRSSLVLKLLHFGQALKCRLMRGKENQSRTSHRLVAFVRWLFWKTGEKTLHHLPLSLLYRLGNWAGSAFYYLDRQRRITIREEIQKLLGKHADACYLDRETRTSFINFVKELLEMFHFPYLNNDKIRKYLTLEGLEHLETALSESKGAVLLTAHFGAHLMPLLALKPYNYSLYQFGTPPAAWEQMTGQRLGPHDRETFAIRHRLEAALPATFIYLNSSLRHIYTILRQNGVLIIAFDGRAGTKWRKIKVLDRTMQISPGPFHIAWRAETPIIPTFTIRQGKKNRIVLGKPLWLDRNKARQEEIDRAMSEFVTVFEDFLRLYPGHYGWLLQAARIRAEHDEFPLFCDPINNDSGTSTKADHS